MRTFIIFLFLISNSSFAGFFQGDYSFAGHTKKNLGDYKQRLDRFKEHFEPEVVELRGAPWDVFVDQENFDFNAYATLDFDGNPQLIVNRGLISHDRMAPEVFDLFLCHELGHLLGGEPRIMLRSGKLSWSSVEGQADYFSTSICMPELGYNQQEIEDVALELSTLIAKLKGYVNLPSLLKRDKSEVYRLLQTHPRPQCRLDTMIAGLYQNERPNCWYAKNR